MGGTCIQMENRTHHFPANRCNERITQGCVSRAPRSGSTHTLPVLTPENRKYFRNICTVLQWWLSNQSVLPPRHLNRSEAKKSHAGSEQLKISIRSSHFVFVSNGGSEIWDNGWNPFYYYKWLFKASFKKMSNLLPFFCLCASPGSHLCPVCSTK